MAVVPERKNTLVLARDFREKLTQRTGITDFDADSKTDTLVSVFVEQVLNARNEAATAFYANQVSSARGDQLDQLGQDMGLPRFAETYAEIGKRDQNVAFYVSTGNFGGLNGGADIVVPAGTLLFSDTDENNLGSRIEYKTTSSVTLSAARTIAYVGCRATASGSRSNLGGGMLKNHSFTSYVAGTGLEVVNFFSVINGRARENDRNYRFRLSRRYDTLVSSNDSKLHLTSLRVPGVLDTRIISGYHGVGTVGVVVVGPENQSTTTTVRAVQSRLNSLRGPAARITALPATAVYFDLEMEVRTTAVLNGPQKRQLELVIRRALKNYFRSQGIGGSVSLLDASTEIAQYSNGAVKLSSLGKPEEVFDTVYVRKGPSAGLSTERDILKNSFYTMDEDEYADLGTLNIRYVT